MKASFVLALLPVALAATATSSASAACTTPALPAACSGKNDVHLVCLHHKLWCQYTDPDYGTQQFIHTGESCPTCMEPKVQQE